MTQYEKLDFVNGSPPALNAATLNHIEDGIVAAAEGVTVVEKTVEDNKAETDTALAKKAEKDSVYTKTEVDEALSGKLDNTAGSVTTDNIASKAVTVEKLAEDVTNQFSKLKCDLGKLSEEINDLKQNGTGGCLLTTETITIGGNTGGGDTEETIPVTLLILDYTTLALNVGDSIQLACSVEPSNATNTTIVWESSNSNIATVDNGYVTAVASGNCTIKAISAENSNIYATCAVVVEANGTGGEDTPTEPTNKVMFSTLTPVKTGAVLKKDGKSEYSNTGAIGYYQLPYSEGMQVSTVTHSGWVNNYPPFIIVDNEAITIPESVDNGIVGLGITGRCYTTTLTGATNTAIVYVNVAYTPKDNETTDIYEKECYYIVGGVE